MNAERSPRMLAPAALRPSQRLSGGARFLWSTTVKAVAAGAGGVVTAMGTLWLDEAAALGLPVSVENARTLVGGLVTSLVTLAVFSVWMRPVVAGLAAAQVSSRVVAGYLDDDFQWKLIIGMAGAFTFTVTLLLGLPSGDGRAMPAISTTVAVVAVVFGLVTVLGALRNAVQGMSLPRILSSLAEQVQRTIADDPAPNDPWPRDGSHDVRTVVTAHGMGWVRSIRRDILLEQIPPGAQLGLRVDIGSFVAEGDLLASCDHDLTEDAVAAIHDAIELAAVRFPQGDVGFVLQQLRDLAEQALSTNGHDSSTSFEALLYLRAVLTQFIDRGVPSGHALGPEDRVVIAMGRHTVSDHLRVTLEPLVYAAARADPVGARSVNSAVRQLAWHAARTGDVDSSNLLEGFVSFLEAEAPDDPATDPASPLSDEAMQAELGPDPTT